MANTNKNTNLNNNDENTKSNKFKSIFNINTENQNNNGSGNGNGYNANLSSSVNKNNLHNKSSFINFGNNNSKLNDSNDMSLASNSTAVNQTSLSNASKQNRSNEPYNLNIIHCLKGLLGIEKPNIYNKFEKEGDPELLKKLNIHTTPIIKNEKEYNHSHKIMREVKTFSKTLTDDPNKLNVNRPVTDIENKRLDMSVKNYFDSFGESKLIKPSEASKYSILKKKEISGRKIFDEDILKEKITKKDSFEKFMTGKI